LFLLELGKKSDFDKFSEIENAIPLILDVTDLDTIQSAVKIIQEQKTGIYGLVNNAGLGSIGFHSAFNEEEFQTLFDVNVFGPWRVTNHFMDLLVQSKGRIVNIGSPGGIVTKKMFGPYTMTKFALEAYTDSLREEIAPLGLHSSIVQPGGIVSEIGQKSMPGIIRRYSNTPEPFTKEALRVLEAIKNPSPIDENAPESNTNRKPSDPLIVSEAVYEALFSANPKNRYLVGTHWEGLRVINHMIEKLLDENDNPVHNFDRNQLIAMLDEHLESRKLTS